ncbi:MAG: hypothetical protein QM742_10810 [Aquabacterium sp.]
MRRHASFLGMAALTALLCHVSVAHAAEFNLFIQCKGELTASGKSKAALLDLALRDNNTTALIQRSNVLPKGERLVYTQTPTDYTLVYKLRQPGTHYYQDWANGSWVVWQPNLKRLATIRLAIDRQEGELEGELLDFDDELLGTLKMDCDAVDPDELPPPKF